MVYYGNSVGRSLSDDYGGTSKTLDFNLSATVKPQFSVEAVNKSPAIIGTNNKTIPVFEDLVVKLTGMTTDIGVRLAEQDNRGNFDKNYMVNLTHKENPNRKLSSFVKQNNTFMDTVDHIRIRREEQQQDIYVLHIKTDFYMVFVDNIEILNTPLPPGTYSGTITLLFEEYSASGT